LISVTTQLSSELRLVAEWKPDSVRRRSLFDGDTFEYSLERVSDGGEVVDRKDSVNIRGGGRDQDNVWIFERQ
jgi:hypothetical protein